jgi:DNA-binding GntR family transcriptional regulator
MRSVGSLSKDDITRMRSAIKEMEQAHRSDDLAAMTTANRRFHFTVFDAAEMPRMTDMIRVLWESTDRYRSVYYASAAHRRRVNTEHRAIMSAVAAGDAERAATLLREHRHHALEALCRSLPPEEPATSPRLDVHATRATH